MFGVSQGGESEERMDGREPDVSSARTITPVDFQVMQERTHQCGIDIFEAERRRCLCTAVLDEGEQELESVAVGVDGVGAHVSLTHEAFFEEGLERAREGGRAHEVAS